MSEQEKFLARWSRRKREGGSEEPARPAKAGVAEEAKLPPGAPANATDKGDAEQAQENFDVSQLPSLDSISADTDIRDFLKPGVPTDLSRAALRRAWAADPAIRDFIGLSENSWDFNANEMHGFGALDPSDNLRKLLAQATGTPDPVEEIFETTGDDTESRGKAASGIEDTESEAPQQREQLESNSPAGIEPIATASSGTEISHNSDAATQQDDFDRPFRQRRKSGGALPT